MKSRPVATWRGCANKTAEPMSALTASQFDERMMDIALRMALRGLGNTAPNPSVGAVIADEASQTIVARGWTQAGGRPHAETQALDRAGPDARSRTMYVTLEPCSHQGRTGPCARAIIDAGIARVVAAQADPDPRVSNRGFRMLRDAGIEVSCGLRGSQARKLTLGHILRVTERRPLVQLKMAVGVDGRIARGGDGKAKWVTGEDARAVGHLMRARADAIVVGRQTVIDDDPSLDCRLPGLAGRSPLRVVLADNPEQLLDAKLWEAEGPSGGILFCGPGVNPFDGRCMGALSSGARDIRVKNVAHVGGQLWLPAVMDALIADGVTRILVEGGPTLWQAFARAGLADEVVLFHACADGDNPVAAGAGYAVLDHYLSGGAAIDDKFELVSRRPLPACDMLVFARK